MLGVSGCEDGQSVASASANGSLHLWRVEYTTRGGAPGANRFLSSDLLFETALPLPLDAFNAPCMTAGVCSQQCTALSRLSEL